MPKKTTDEPAPDAPEEPDTPPAPTSEVEDEMRRRFKEALAHKSGTSGAQNRGHESGHGPALRSNDKRQRTFRRKAGG